MGRRGWGGGGEGVGEGVGGGGGGGGGGWKAGSERVRISWRWGRMNETDLTRQKGSVQN